MATSKQHSLRDKIREDQHRLETGLKATVGISLTTYKTVKWIVQGIGVVGGIIAMTQLDAQPITTLLIMLLMIHGPEAMEYFLANGGTD